MTWWKTKCQSVFKQVNFQVEVIVSDNSGWHFGWLGINMKLTAVHDICQNFVLNLNLKI